MKKKYLNKKRASKSKNKKINYYWNNKYYKNTKNSFMIL